MINPPHRDIVPMVPRWKCEHPGCDADAAVSLRRGGPIGADIKLCDVHDLERFADFDPPAHRGLVRPPTKASLAVGGTLLLIGAAEAAASLAAVAWSRATSSLAPNWAATLWSNGVLIGAFGLISLAILVVVERIIEARSQ